MKRLGFLYMMIFVTTFTASSQDIGDHYSGFLNSGYNYIKEIDNSGKGYLLLKDGNLSVKYYFEDGYCNTVMVISKNKRSVDVIFEKWILEADSSIVANNGLTIYKVGDNGAFSYRTQYIKGEKYYILEIIKY